MQFQVGIGYLDDIEKGREIIERAARRAEGVLAEPAAAAYVTELGESSVNFTA